MDWKAKPTVSTVVILCVFIRGEMFEMAPGSSRVHYVKFEWHAIKRDIVGCFNIFD